MTCPYITSLERECGRTSTHSRFCAFHAVLHEFETNCGDPSALRIAIGELK